MLDYTLTAHRVLCMHPSCSQANLWSTLWATWDCRPQVKYTFKFLLGGFLRRKDIDAIPTSYVCFCSGYQIGNTRGLSNIASSDILPSNFMILRRIQRRKKVKLLHATLFTHLQKLVLHYTRFTCKGILADVLHIIFFLFAPASTVSSNVRIYHHFNKMLQRYVPYPFIVKAFLSP